MYVSPYYCLYALFFPTYFTYRSVNFDEVENTFNTMKMCVFVASFFSALPAELNRFNMCSVGLHGKVEKSSTLCKCRPDRMCEPNHQLVLIAAVTEA